MGIVGLLQGLKCYATDGNIRDYANQSVAVDASSWLHKSVYSIADHYVEATESNPDSVADRRSVAVSSSYVQKRCQELLTYANIRCIYLVMDGKRCPLKVVTNQERQRKCRANLEEARKCRQAGDKEGMYEKYKTCIKVTDTHARAVAEDVARRFPNDNRVQIVWAPFEADAQLVKLCIDGLAQAVITEDSDVLVYSAACHVSVPILYKLDRNNGSCSVISVDWLLSSSNNNNNNVSMTAVNNKNKKKSTTSGLEPILQTLAARQARSPGLGVRLFVQACVLTGCDYSPNLLVGVGTVSAFKHVQSSIHRTSDDRFRHTLNLLPRRAFGSVNKIEYEELLAKSEAVFYYHPVRDIATGQVVYLCNPRDNKTNTERHIPSLERFGGDWTFLGQLSQENDQVLPVVDPLIPQQLPPVKHHHHHKTSRKRVLPLHEDPDLRMNSGSNKVPKVVAMANPYLLSKKQKSNEEQQRRKPLKNIQNNTDDNNDAAVVKEKGSKNPFFQFGFKKKKGPLDKFPDVRFVKREFSKNDSCLLLSLAKTRAEKSKTTTATTTVGASRTALLRVPQNAAAPADQRFPGCARMESSDLPLLLDSSHSGNVRREAFDYDCARDAPVVEQKHTSRFKARLPQQRSLDSVQQGMGALSQRSKAANFTRTMPLHDTSFDRFRVLGSQKSDDSSPVIDLTFSYEEGQEESDQHPHGNAMTSYGRDHRLTRELTTDNEPAQYASSLAFDSFLQPDSPDVGGIFEENASVHDNSFAFSTVSGAVSKPARRNELRFQHSFDDDDSVIMESQYLADDLKAPFGNPDLRSSKAGTTSKYFGGCSREESRRVTFESPEKSSFTALPADRNDHFSFPGASAELSQGQLQPSFQYDHYDDFLESPGDKAGAGPPSDDEIIDSPESLKGGLSLFKSNAARARFVPPRPKSSIGPSKTMRFRFGRLG